MRRTFSVRHASLSATIQGGPISSLVCSSRSPDGYQEQAARAYNNLSAMAVSRRQYDKAARYLRAGAGVLRAARPGIPGGPTCLHISARMKFEQGDWLEASDDVEAVLRHPRTTPVTRIPALRTLGHLRIRRGDPDASSPLDEARALAGPEPELQRFGTLAAVAAEAAWLAGDREGVLREVRPAYEMVLPSTRSADERRTRGLAMASRRSRAAVQRISLNPTRWRSRAIGRVRRGTGRSWDVRTSGRSCSDGTEPSSNSVKLSRSSINWGPRRLRRLCAGRCARVACSLFRAAHGHRHATIHSA